MSLSFGRGYRNGNYIKSSTSCTGYEEENQGSKTINPVEKASTRSVLAEVYETFRNEYQKLDLRDPIEHPT